MTKEEALLKKMQEADLKMFRDQYDETGLVDGELCEHDEDFIEYDKFNYPYCGVCGYELEPDWDLIAKYETTHKEVD